MQSLLLRQLKRLLPVLLGIGTMLFILGLSLYPSTAQQRLAPQDPPAFGTPLQKEGRGTYNTSLLSGSRETFSTPLDKGGRGDLAQATPPTSPALDLVQQGKTAYQKGQLQQAITLWKQATDTFTAQGDRLHQAMTLSYLAQAYQQLGDWKNANAAIAQSLQLLKQSTQGAGDRLHILAEAQTIQGSLQLDQGQASEAYASWQQALNAFQEAGDRAGVIRSQINQSQALLDLGLYKRANQLLASLYKTLPPEEPLQLAILLNYGETRRLVGHLQNDALEQPQPSESEPDSATILQKGLTLAQKLQSPADITKAQISLGNTYRAIYQQQERLQDSPCPNPTVLAYRQKALAFYQAAADSTHSPISKIQALLNQQSLLLTPPSDNTSISPAQTEQALAIAAPVQAVIDHLPLDRTALYARIQLAYNLLKLDGVPSKLKTIETNNQAVQLLKTAVDAAKKLGDGSAQSYALGYLGQLYEQQQQGEEAQKLTTQALTLTTEALNLAKTLNAPEIAYRWFWQLGRLDRATNPERAIKNYYAAYITLQKLRQDLAADNLDLQFSFRAQPVEPVYREFVDLLLQPHTVSNKALPDLQLKTAQSKQEDPLANPLYTARRVIQDLQSVELANFLQAPCAPSNIEAIDKKVDAFNSFTATLYPILLHDRIEVIAKFPGQPLIHNAYPIAQADVQKKIKQFQLDLQEPYTFDAVKQEGQELYQWLIKPIQAQLENAQIKTIIFALDGPLRNFPMATLHDGKGYLIEKYAVAVTLDLDVTDPQPLLKDRLNVLAASLADPPKGKEFRGFAKLGQVDHELDKITQTKGVVATDLRDSQFTQKAFNKAFNDSSFQIVHLATHGEFSSNPQQTFILNANGKVRLSDFDAMFRTRELNRADPIALLILSACETASGDDRATLGIAGAAVKAGARSAIASLWSLDDESSQTLITTFYKTITQPHTSRAEALRQAQLALLQARDGPYTHPRHWAPFLLVGNWL